jgi:hypothetical protein
MPSRPAPLAAALAVCALLVGTAVVMTWQGLALAGDGSYYLVRILGNDGFFGPDPRFLANVVRQTPVLVATKVGATDTRTLTLVHGLGLLVIPALVWSFAVLRSRSNQVAFAAVALTASLCAGTTWFFAISESVLAVSLTALVAVLLWQSRAWGWTEAALAVGACTILLASYETAVLTGSVLAVWAFARSRRADGGLERYACLVVAATSALSAIAAVAGVNAGPGPTNAQSFMYFVLSLDPWGFYVGLAGVVAIVVALGLVRARGVRAVLLGVGFVAALVAIFGRDISSPKAFEARGGAAIAVLLLELFLAWSWWRARREAPAVDTPGWYVVVPVALVAGMVATSLVAANAWSDDLDTFRATVDETDGVRRAADVLPAGHRRVLWDWTAASLSLVVRNDASAGILVDVDPSYLPFTPAEARDQLSDEYAWR